jgi:protein ImuB
VTEAVLRNGDPMPVSRIDPPPRRLYLATWFPFLPADRVRREKRKSNAASPETPFVLVEKQGGALRLAAIDRLAAQAGFRPGTTLADARAGIGPVEAIEMDRAADAAFLAACAAACERYTPLTALDGADGLILDITGCAHLFGGEEAIRASLLARLTRFGLAAQAAVAGTPDAARAFARFSRIGHVPAVLQEKAARTLPIAALDEGAETTLALTRAGLTILDDLADRSRAALTARFGSRLVDRLDRVLGRQDIRIAPLRPPPDCMVEERFAEPLMEARAIEDKLARLAGSLCRDMEGRGQGGRRFVLTLFRSDGVTRFLAVETGAPCRETEVILRLFRLRLETLADPLDPGFGFDAMRVGVFGLERLAHRAPAFGEKAADEVSLSDLVDRLAVRFGRENVARFVARDSHDPARAAALRPAADDDDIAGSWPMPEPGQPPLRPLTVFRPPQPIEVLAEVPDGAPLRFRWRRRLHEVALSEGPERIAWEWWRARSQASASQPSARDYYRVEDSEGGRYWLFREGLYGESGEPPRWFLYGLFA